MGLNEPEAGLVKRLGVFMFIYSNPIDFFFFFLSFFVVVVVVKMVFPIKIMKYKGKTKALLAFIIL